MSSLRLWLKQQDLSKCFAGLQKNGVTKQKELLEFKEQDFLDIGQELQWGRLITRRLITAVSTLDTKKAAAPKRTPGRPVVRRSNTESLIKVQRHGKKNSISKSSTLRGKPAYNRGAARSANSTKKGGKSPTYKTLRSPVKRPTPKDRDRRGSLPPISKRTALTTRQKRGSQPASVIKRGVKKKTPLKRTLTQPAKRPRSQSDCGLPRASTIKKSISVTSRRSRVPAGNKRTESVPRKLGKTKSSPLAVRSASVNRKRASISHSVPAKKLSLKDRRHSATLPRQRVTKTTTTRDRHGNILEETVVTTKIITDDVDESDEVKEKRRPGRRPGRKPIASVPGPGRTSRTAARRKQLSVGANAGKKLKARLQPHNSYSPKYEESEDIDEDMEMLPEQMRESGLITQDSEHDLDDDLLEIVEIPVRMPRLNTIENMLEAIVNSLISCDAPELTTETQGEIVREILTLQGKIDDELYDELTEEIDLNVRKMKNQVEEIEKFGYTVMDHRDEMEVLYEKLQSESPEEQSDLLREMAKHRDVLATNKDFAEEYYSALTQLEVAKEKLVDIDTKTYAEMKAMRRPPKVLSDLITGVCLLCGMKDPNWRQASAFICGKGVRKKLMNFDIRNMDTSGRRRAAQFIEDHDDSFDVDVVERVNRKAVALAEWVEGIYGLLGWMARLEAYPDGPRILEQIETAYAELKKNKAELKRLRMMSRCWQNVLEQVEYDIEILKKCEKSLKRISTRRAIMVGRFEALEVIPQIPETKLPEAYQSPYEDACKNINTRFGELTQIEFKFVFAMIKKYFVVLLHLFKTYASFEGKNGQGLKGMSAMVWGILCKAMKLPNVTDRDKYFTREEDEKEERTGAGGSIFNEIFNLSSVETLETDSNQVKADEEKTKRQQTKRGGLPKKEKQDATAMGITGIWKCGESTQRKDLWTIEVHLGQTFSGFIGCEKEATIEGTIGPELDQIEFVVQYSRQASRYSGVKATCKGVVLDNGSNLRVRYNMSTKKRGYWILSKTGVKIRTVCTKISTLKYDSFIEAIIRLSIFLWPEKPAWDAVEALMDNHAIQIALELWDCFPSMDRAVIRIMSDRENKRLLDSLFGQYSYQRRDKKEKGKLITYVKWEQFVRKVNRWARGQYITASFRTIQFAFFASKELFPQDGPLEELNRREFKEAVARLAFKMVGGVKSSSSNRALDSKEAVEMPPLDRQCRVMLTWLKEVKRH